MNPTMVANLCLQTKIGSVLGGPLQNFLQNMATCSPCKGVSTFMRYGEKTVFPFADDMFELVWHRCREGKVEDKKYVGKKDFKMCKCGLSARHAILRSQIAASSAVLAVNKSSPLVFLTVADPDYQPVMQELCSEERYIDAEIVHRRLLWQRFKNGLSIPENYLPSKLKISTSIMMMNQKAFQVHHSQRMTFQLDNLQVLSNRIARTKRLLRKDFYAFSCSRRSKFSKIQENKAMIAVDKVVKNATILGQFSMRNQQRNSVLINRNHKTHRR
ncbi:uncharacterized protein CDAR_48121 [Caerostris darwini]|uniref:Uncharacterized protein n=1 Tax=Caerostris darwini TaxID=1538125 RepID=A0AAV4W1S6_9ARAC|nr:uncharacterized protein CDAR_48121 [Caerostris darwini]